MPDIVTIMRKRELAKASEILRSLDERITKDLDGEHTPERYHEWLDIVDLKYIIESLVKLEES